LDKHTKISYEIIFGDEMSEYEILLEKAKNFHGDVCPGIVMGTRMTMAAMRELGMNPQKRNRNLIVYVEIDRCMTDAVQAITGVSLGHRTLKYIDYGKFAATFVDTAKNRAIRVSTINRPNPEGEDRAATTQRLSNMPENELLKIEEIDMEIPENDISGFPRQTTACETCGEKIMDGREVIFKGKTLCRACADVAYYKKVDIVPCKSE
jgi:Formylmethanofuran dehydrogenase subunit E